MADGPPKWRRYEDLVARIQRELAPMAAQVTQDERVLGVITQVKRQIDVAVRIEANGVKIFTVIDAKDYADPIDVKEVEAFMGLVEDVAANKGILVAPNGFSMAARRRARAAGIDLFSAVDVENTDWPAYVTLPTVVVSCSPLVSFSLSLDPGFHGPIALADLADIPNMELLDNHGSSVGTPSSHFVRYWNEETVNLDAQEFEIARLTPDSVHMTTAHGLLPIHVGARVRINRTVYFGHLPLTRARGFAEAERQPDGLFVFRTRSITTDWLSFAEVESRWDVIDGPDSLAVRPTLMLIVAKVLDESLPADCT